MNYMLPNVTMQVAQDGIYMPRGCRVKLQIALNSIRVGLGLLFKDEEKELTSRPFVLKI